MQELVDDWKSILEELAGSGSDDIAAMIGGAADESLISFAAGFPDSSTFSSAALRTQLAEVCADPAAMQYGPTAGLPGPRAWITERIERTDGRRPGDDELVLTSGGMEAVTLVATALLAPGRLALVEDPTFLGAIMALQRQGPRVQGVPMDGFGLDPDALGGLLATESPTLLYVIPDHHNPTGITLDLERRHRLVELARHHGFLLVEDVAYRDLGFDGTRLPSLWSLAPDVTVQLGTFSKTFTPGFRMGWAVGPASLVAEMVRVKQITDQCAGSVGQLLLERHGRSGELDRAVERMRGVYAERCATMMAALAAQFSDGAVTYTEPSGGFFTWLTLDAGVDPGALVSACLSQGVAGVPGATFYADGHGRGTQLRLAFSHVPTASIPEGVARLRRATDDVTPRSGGAGRRS